MLVSNDGKGSDISIIMIKYMYNNDGTHISPDLLSKEALAYANNLNETNLLESQWPQKNTVVDDFSGSVHVHENNYISLLYCSFIVFFMNAFLL